MTERRILPDDLPLRTRLRDINGQGDGLAEVDGKEVAIPGALPGDMVEFPPDGHPARVVDQAHRPASAVCPHRHCPGCPLLPLPYPEQLEAKQRLVERALRRHLPGSSVPEVLPPWPSPSLLGYRASAKLAMARDRRGVRVGIYRRGTHDVVDIPRCPVHHPLVAAGVRALRSLLRQAPGLVALAGGRDWLRYAAFQASVADGALLLTLVTASPEREGILRSLCARLRERLPQLSGVVWNVNPGPGNEIFGVQWRTLWGVPWIRERFGGLWLRASAGAFLQVNREQAAQVYEAAVTWLAPGAGEDALDLYCGVGGLTFSLAGRARRVVGIESNPLSVADARHTAAGNVSFVEADAAKGLEALLAGGFRPAVATLNPARKGLDEGVIRALRGAGPRAIVYLSCNPETLARDLARLGEGGNYRPTRVQPVDFFPHTGHVEVLALMERA